jgi:hypothetical protein
LIQEVSLFPIIKPGRILSAYQNLRTGLVTKNGVAYNLQYDSATGNVQIIQQNAPAGTNPIYQDGSWNASSTELGFTTNEKNQLHIETIISVQAAYRNIGGVASGAKLPRMGELKIFQTELLDNHQSIHKIPFRELLVEMEVSELGEYINCAGGGTTGARWNWRNNRRIKLEPLEKWRWRTWGFVWIFARPQSTL